MKASSFFESLGYAVKGFVAAVKGERNLRFHLSAAGGVTFLGLWLGLKPLEWTALVLIFGVVIAGELINTAIETVVDLICPDYHPLAKKAKDIAAGAVLILALSALIIGFIIFLPHFKG